MYDDGATGVPPKHGYLSQGRWDLAIVLTEI